MNPFLGEIRIFAGKFAPRGWAFCQGQILSINDNQALFGLFQTMYGGDGVNTFGLPDLRGRVPVSASINDGDPRVINLQQGRTAGTETVRLTQLNLPIHNHTGSGNFKPKASVELGTSPSPENKYLADSNGTDLKSEMIYTRERTTPVLMGPQSFPVPIDNNGGGGAMPNIQPILSMNYIVCIEGNYPPQD